MITTPILALALSVTSVALADDDHDGAGNTFSVLLGTSSAFDQDPATLRLSARLDLGLGEGSVLGGYLLVPVTLSWRGEDRVALSASRTVVEVPLSLRGRLFPRSFVRAYGDVGIGVAFGSGWIVNDPNTSAAAWITRTALGIELGKPDKWSVAIEPASVTSYAEISGQPDARAPVSARYGLMVGLGFRI